MKHFFAALIRSLFSPAPEALRQSNHTRWVKRGRYAGALPLVALALVFGSPSLLAATRTWTGNSINNPDPAKRDNSWTNALNWSNSLAPLVGDNLFFPSAGTSQLTSINNFAPATAFGSITIGNHSMSGAGIALNGGITASAGAQILLGTIKLNFDQTFNAPSSGSGALVNSPIDTNGKQLTLDGPGNFTVAGVISGSGTLTKDGAGTVTLLGNNTYSGTTRVSSGTLLVNGSQPQSNVSTSAILGGTGTVGPVTVSDLGTIDPGAAGNGTGILSASGSVIASRIFVSSPEMNFDIKGTTAGSSHDQLIVGGTGTLNLGDALCNLSVTIGGGYVPASGDTFVIINNTGPNPIAGQFFGKPEGSFFTVGSTTFQISYKGGDGNDVTITAVSGVVSFTSNTFSVNEGDGSASITLRRSGDGSKTIMAAVALEDITTNSADYVSPAGKLDPTFNAAASVNALNDAAVQPDGKIIVVGTAFSSNPGGKTIARYNADGSLDSTFNPGTGANGSINAVALQSNGKILIGGNFTRFNGTPRAEIARLNENGFLDPTFDPGSGANSEVKDIAIQPDGNIIIGGSFTTYGGVSRPVIARLTPSGSLDTSFVSDAGFTAFGTLGPVVRSVELDGSGRILIGGLFTTSGAAPPRRNVARLNANGSLDTSFDPGTGTAGGLNGGVLTILAQPDEKIIISGAFDTYNGVSRIGVARLERNGALDLSFDPHAGVSGEAACMVLQPDGKIIIGGGFSKYDNVPRVGLVRIRSDGSLDRTFDPGTGIVRSLVFALVLQPDGKLIIGGAFDTYNGSSVNGVARVRGDLVAIWGPNDFANKTVQLPIVDDNLFEGNEKLNLRIIPLTSEGRGVPGVTELTIVDNDVQAKAVNIATRLRVETGDNVMIAGFIVTGNVPKPVVLRGMGPLLGNFGISDFLADPVLDLRGPGGSIFKNDNWKDTQRAQIEGTPFQPADDRESVIVATLAPDAYTAILTGKNNTTGVGLIEVYDNGATANSQLGNISTRGLVQGNNNVMIGGFILGGTTDSRIAIRGIGPSLAQFGLNNVLANPTLELHDGNGATLIVNDDWENNSTSAAQLRSSGLQLSDSKEAGIFTALPPGPFTAILAGKNGGSGIGLIEIYNLQ